MILHVEHKLKSAVEAVDKEAYGKNVWVDIVTNIPGANLQPSKFLITYLRFAEKTKAIRINLKIATL